MITDTSPSISPIGPTTDLFGQALAPASRSAAPEGKKARLMNVISGRLGKISSESESLQRYLESRLQTLLPTAGSMKLQWTWKTKTTPLRRRLSQLALRVPSTDVTASGLWPTPAARDHFPPHKPEYIAMKKAQGHGMSNLNDMATLSLWQTPVADDAIDRAKGKINSRGEPKLSAQAIQHSNGSSGLTENPGQLSPEFVCWLMGFPPEWDESAPTAMPSTRKPRRPS